MLAADEKHDRRNGALGVPQKIDRHVEYRVRDYVVRW
jgi:hypothetical protein